MSQKPLQIKGSEAAGDRMAILISSQSRYDHFDTLPFTVLLYHIRRGFARAFLKKLAGIFAAAVFQGKCRVGWESDILKDDGGIFPVRQKSGEIRVRKWTQSRLWVCYTIDAASWIASRGDFPVIS